MVAEARLADYGSGLAPATDGWFVVNARDATWLTHDVFGASCVFESPDAEFADLGVRLSVLEPGQPNGLYHGEETQEGFLVLHGVCLLLVEGEERPLRAWDFFHCPNGTEHILVGAGDGPCVLLMTGNGSPGGPSTTPSRSSPSGIAPVSRSQRRRRPRPTPAIATSASSGRPTGTRCPGRRPELPA